MSLVDLIRRKMDDAAERFSRLTLCDLDLHLAPTVMRNARGLCARGCGHEVVLTGFARPEQMW